GLDAAQGLEHLLADLTIHLHHGYCRCFLPTLLAAEREVGDVDIVLPKHSTDAAHNARHVEIAQVDEGPLQRRLHVNAIDFQQSWHATRLNAAGHRVFLLTGFEGHTKHVGDSAARVARFFALGDADATL